MDERKLQHARDTYKENQIKMASKEQLLLITYDIGIKHCLAAERAIANNNIEMVNFNLQKAQAVIRELMVTIDMEKGGEIAKTLMQLYDFMYYRLVDANVQRNSEMVLSVRVMLEELKTTWEQAIAKLKSEEKKSPVTATATSQTGGANFAY